MNTVFTEILNMSITASWMIIAVVILRFFTRKISKNLNIFMWGLVGLRLLLPFSFKSKISAVPSAETFPTEPIIEKGYSINSGIPVIDVPVNEYIESIPMEQATEAAKKTVDTMSVLGIVWLCGFAVLMLYGIISCVLLRRKVSASMKEVNNIYICDDIKGAFIFGIFKPRIYLPSLLPVWQREYVVYHEKEHLKRRDHIWKPVAFLIACLHWFNPFVWLAYILFCRDIELSCDERVVRKMDKDEKKSYSLALLACAIPHRKLVAAPLAFGEVGVKTRIKSALNYKKPTFWVIVVALILCIGVAVLFMTDPMDKDKPIEQEPIETQEILPDETEPVDTAEPIDTPDTEEITDPEPTPEAGYVEAPYPSGLTVEEKIAGNEVYDLGVENITWGIDLEKFSALAENLPDKFAVTNPDIPDFAAIVEYTETLTGNKGHAITTIYYKNVELELDQNHYILFAPQYSLLYDDNILAAGYHNRYYSGWAYLISANNYTIVGEEQTVTTDDPLDTYPSYAFYVKNGELQYKIPCVAHSLFISSNQESGGLFPYLSKESDLDHLYLKYGKVVYEEGNFKLIDYASKTIRENWFVPDNLQKEYEAAMFDDEIYEKYPTYQEYLAAKEQNLLPEDHYYYRGKYGENY